MQNFLPSIHSIITSRLTRDTSVVIFGNLISSSLAVVFTILAARFLGPENWGVVAAVGSLITIFVAVCDLGLSSALFRFVSKVWVEGKQEEALKIIKTIWSLRLASVLLFSAILIIFSEKLTQLLIRTNDPSFMIFVALGLIGALFIDFQIAESEAKQEWRKAAIFISLTNILRVGGLFLVGFSNLTLVNVIFIFTGSSAVAYMISLIWQHTQLGFELDSKKIREIIPFSGFMGVNRMVSSFNSRVDVLILIQIAGAYEAGIYGAANRLAIGVPLILASFATVLAPKFSSLSEHELPGFFKRSLGLSAAITGGLVLGIFIAPFVISLFGPAYQKSSPVLQLLFLSFIPASISVPAVNYVIYGLRKPQIITVLSLIQLPLVLFLNLLLIPKIGVTAPALVLTVVNSLTAIVCFVVSWWVLGTKRLFLSERKRVEG